MTLNWCIFNSTWNDAKHILICALVFSLVVGASYGGTWRDSFEDGVLNGWEPDVEKRTAEWRVRWATRADSLEVHVKDTRPWNLDISRLSQHITAFLALTAFELDEEHLVVEGISVKREHMAFGIAIGQRYPPSVGWFGTVYHFNIWGYIRKLNFIGTGGFRGLKPPKVNYVNPEKPVDTKIEHLRVVFDTGRFQLFSADNLVAEMVDPEYKTVDLVGIMIWGETCGSGSLDESVISGPCIPNGTGNVTDQPTNKLVTTWGCIKRRSRPF